MSAGNCSCKRETKYTGKGRNNLSENFWEIRRKKRNMIYRGKETAFQRRGRNDLSSSFQFFSILISTKMSENVKCRFQFNRSTFLMHSEWSHSASKQRTFGVARLCFCLVLTNEEFSASGYNFLLTRNGLQTTGGRESKGG